MFAIEEYSFNVRYTHFTRKLLYNVVLLHVLERT